MPCCYLCGDPAEATYRLDRTCPCGRKTDATPVYLCGPCVAAVRSDDREQFRERFRYCPTIQTEYRVAATETFGTPPARKTKRRVRR
jgi:hypothetical protein